MTQLKTVRQHLNDLAEPYRSQALKNCKHNYILSKRYPTQREALRMAFDFEKTPHDQGAKYWWDFYKSLMQL